MNLVSSHHYSFLPGAHTTAGSAQVTQTDSPANKLSQIGDTDGVTDVDPEKARRELQLEARLRVKQAQEQRQIEAQIRDLAARDREVRTHEQAHVAAGGQYAGAPVYQYERGPNGVNYAVGGEVSISTGEEATPQATLRKAQIIRRAALAPAEPSPQDRRVAAMAAGLEAAARAEIAQAAREDDASADSETSEAADTPTASADPETSPIADTFTASAGRPEDDTARLHHKLFTRDKVASNPPGTLFSHMA